MKCAICGTEIKGSYYLLSYGSLLGGKPACSKECHSEGLHISREEFLQEGHDADNNIVFVLDNNYYTITPEDDSGLRGYSGRNFIIYFHTGPLAGKVIKTTNLWNGGEHKSEYVETAEFLTEAALNNMDKDKIEGIYKLYDWVDGEFVGNLPIELKLVKQTENKNRI